MTGIIELTENGFWKSREHPLESLERSATLFNELKGNTIIEIGTGIHGEMSGNSVIVWVEKTKATKIICLDLEEKHVKDVKEATKGFPQVIAKKEDGISFLKNYKEKIDLLYLDFWVQDKPGDLTGTARANAYLLAYQAAKDKLQSNSIILIDDTDHIDPWKQSYIVPAARKDGYIVLYCGRQTLLIRRN